MTDAEPLPIQPMPAPARGRTWLRSSRTLAWLAAALTVSLATLGVTTVAGDRAAGEIEEGDFVRFHYTIRRHGDGTVLYTTDPERAAGELAQGNPHLEPNLTRALYRYREVYVDVRDEAVQASRFLLGHRAGETVVTPAIVDAIGVAARYTVPATLGPFEPEFSVNVTQLYADNGTATRGVPADTFRPGQRIPYADVLEAVVIQVEGDVATLRFDFTEPAGRPIYSKVLGLNLTYEVLPDGRVVLHPLAGVGDAFTTRGCKLPGDVLPPGRYRIEQVRPHGLLVKEAPALHEPLLDETVWFEFQVLHVDQWPEARRAGQALADSHHAIANGIGHAWRVVASAWP